jgi:hypothetical protein
MDGEIEKRYEAVLFLKKKNQKDFCLFWAGGVLRSGLLRKKVLLQIQGKMDCLGG